MAMRTELSPELLRYKPGHLAIKSYDKPSALQLTAAQATCLKGIDRAEAPQPTSQSLNKPKRAVRVLNVVTPVFRLAHVCGGYHLLGFSGKRKFTGHLGGACTDDAT